MAGTGMKPREILRAGTAAPADYWGMEGLGRIELGAWASLLILRGDPLTNQRLLAQPAAVIIAGEPR